ncbi:hypothetical protein H9X85_10795 [Anaerotignum lactatifermentans]|uniref:SAP domain-containing protein n=1 Tax=Anaerotignum lactatifermentans TaxID=160404 RepID=A0ABS2GBP7_9FIRM|nr:SAP domain-containing protein [Anaerotignum lactatifermentans]MBM6830010.1 hypothetical protein [Anaerotignum lactatifermentans]MBM6878602.1 hypothetical protein [Anaerotignum lactatifermentans]MBM6951685.1 hypothetical protein [Anaerotignum lactatifermentans]
MWVKAVKSFGGKVSMRQGQEMELEENDTLKDLLEAGYVTKIMGQVQTEPDKGKEKSVENQNSNADDSEDQGRDEAERKAGYLDEADLEEMSAADLKKLAKEMGISTAGTKKEIIQRMIEVEVEIGPEAEGDACENQ